MSHQQKKYFVFGWEKDTWVRYEVLSLDPPSYLGGSNWGFVRNLTTKHVHYSNITAMYRTPARFLKPPSNRFYGNRFPYCHTWTDLPLSKDLVLPEDKLYKGMAYLEKDNALVVVEVLSYDQNKYCQIRYEGQVYEVKLGYLFSCTNPLPTKFPNGSFNYDHKNVANVQRWNLPTYRPEFPYQEWSFK